MVTLENPAVAAKALASAVAWFRLPKNHVVTIP
jgi:hypothetical protein